MNIDNLMKFVTPATLSFAENMVRRLATTIIAEVEAAGGPKIPEAEAIDMVKSVVVTGIELGPVYDKSYKDFLDRHGAKTP